MLKMELDIDCRGSFIVDVIIPVKSKFSFHMEVGHYAK